MNVLQYQVRRPDTFHPVFAEVPGSKSITNRALLLAALSDGVCNLDGVLFSDDSRHFLQALLELGFDVEVNEKEKRVRIHGQKGKIPCVVQNVQKEVRGRRVHAVVNVGSAGTAARFLTAFLGMSKGSFYIDASEQMKKRPMKELLCALEQLGASVEYMEEEYHFPFVIGNQHLTAKEVEIDVEKSSQFLSALLISAVLFEEDFHVRVVGKHGMAYVEMTLKMMEQFGVEPQTEAGGYYIHGRSFYKAKDYKVEPDVSAACYFYAMCPLLKQEVQVKDIHANSLQGDIWFLSVLCEMGCTLREEESGIILCPPKENMKGGEFNLSSFSDQALTLAAIAPFADSDVIIRGISHIRHQECDRMHAITSNLERMGVTTESDTDSVVIHPSRPHGALIETFEDHRVSMSFTLCGLLVDGIVIENPSCCRKTFENYFETLEQCVYEK